MPKFKVGDEVKMNPDSSWAGRTRQCNPCNEKGTIESISLDRLIRVYWHVAKMHNCLYTNEDLIAYDV